MPAYSAFIAKLLNREELLQKLQPTEPLEWQLSDEFRSLDDAAVTGGRPISNPQQFTLIRGAILYALDELDAAHRIFQDDHSSVGSYWHGMMHRREGDFDNARYWFRRCGQLPEYGDMQAAVGNASPNMARQNNWDPYLFTGLCEQVRFGDGDLLAECRALQRAEFDVLLASAWEKALG